MIAALPVFAPALIVCIVVAFQFLRERWHWEDEDEDPGREARAG